MERIEKVTVSIVDDESGERREDVASVSNECVEYQRQIGKITINILISSNEANENEGQNVMPEVKPNTEKRKKNPHLSGHIANKRALLKHNRKRNKMPTGRTLPGGDLTKSVVSVSIGQISITDKEAFRKRNKKRNRTFPDGLTKSATKKIGPIDTNLTSIEAFRVYGERFSESRGKASLIANQLIAKRESNEERPKD
jgi:hypothetical protein